MIYLDNAATSFPKPEAVWESMLSYGRGCGASPGRSGHRWSVEASRLLFRCRVALSRVLGVPREDRVIMTKNATEAANYVIYGLLATASGGNVVATSLEHNAVARPLRYWCGKRGVELRVVPCGCDALVDPGLVLDAVDDDTLAVFVNHASNVFGTLFPFEEVARRVRVPVVVDATQTLGAYPVSFGEFPNVFVVFTGHKGLLGPQGTGGFYIPEGFELDPLMRGGTGSNSESDIQPDFAPDRYESGTPNMHGIAGLLGALEWLEGRVDSLRRHELELLRFFVEGARGIKGLVLYGAHLWERRIGVVSFNIEGMDPARVASLLDARFGIACRPGLHCAPWAHRAAGTYPTGTVRFSFGPFNTEGDVEEALKALKSIAEGGHGG